MTTQKQPLLYAAAQAPGGDFRQVLALAWPMILTAVIVSLAQNGQIWILGQQGGDPQALYLLSMLQPFNFLFIALLECLTITNQIFSARSAGGWPRRKVLHSTLLFALGGGVFLLLLALFSVGGASLLQRVYPSDNSQLFTHILPVWLASQVPFLLFELCNAGLRGQGRTTASMLFITGFILLNVVSCYVGFHVLQAGFSAVIYANLIAALVMLPFAAVTLYKTVASGDDPAPGAFLPRLKALMMDAGVPVFLSMLLAFASSAVIFPLLSQIGGNYASGFLIVVKLRTFFIIPAVALGSALAICINQQLASLPPQRLARILSAGLGGITLIYLLLTLAAYAGQTQLVNLLASSNELRLSAGLIMAWLLPTFFMTSLIASIQTVLEQLGRGKRVLIITLVMEALMVTVVLMLSRQGETLPLLMRTVLAFNLIYLLIFVCEYRALVRKTGNRDAV